MFAVDSISIRYDQKTIIHDFSFQVKEGEVVSIIGPNGSGKSTLLKAVSRQLSYFKGIVELDGITLKSITAKQAARKMCMLSQKNLAPADMTVYELVSFGRYPHKKWFEKLNHDDHDIIQWAIDKTHLSAYQERRVTSLSGGESQRAWIAMALAQRPKILLLDEPTTYLDISHQHEVLELVRELNKEMGMTVMMVLHDLNQAARYSDQIIVVKDGKKAMEGTPDQVMTTDMVRQVYRMDCEINCGLRDRIPRIHLLQTARS